MKLAFKTYMNGCPTYFVEKIYKSFYKGVQLNFNELIEYSNKLTEAQKNIINEVFPKLHTLRKDRFNYWLPGEDIEFIIDDSNVDDLFAPVIPVKNIQKIKIQEVFVSENTYNYQKRAISTYYKTKLGKIYQVIIEKKLCTLKKIEELSRNDGFDTVEEFFEYFNTDFEGKIIHWTDFKY